MKIDFELVPTFAMKDKGWSASVYIVRGKHPSIMISVRNPKGEIISNPCLEGKQLERLAVNILKAIKSSKS
jgi:hypothetical protein